MTDRDPLDESLRHLEYEMAMIVATPRMVWQHPLTPATKTTRPDGYFWRDDKAAAYLAAMESSLTHARLLNDFFRYSAGQVPTGGLKANDRYAAEYCKNNGWNGIDLLTEEQRATIDRQLSHFTTLRAPRRTHPIGQYAQNAVVALAELVKQADPEWQGPLSVILTKTRRAAARPRRMEPKLTDTYLGPAYRP
jgi:hypothetical protein